MYSVSVRSTQSGACRSKLYVSVYTVIILLILLGTMVEAKEKWFKKLASNKHRRENNKITLRKLINRIFLFSPAS